MYPYQNYPMYGPNYFGPQVAAPRTILPQQQITQVNGKASVDTIQLAPNSSILVMDTTAPIVWMCISDGVGKVTATPYDIALHEEAAPTNLSDLESRIKRVEQIIAEMGDKSNANKSNASAIKSKPNDSKAIPD